MAQSERLMQHIGAFRIHAENLLMRIVDEMHLPVSDRTYAPYDDLPSAVHAFCKQEDEAKVYIEDNIILKVTHNDKREEVEIEEDLSFRPQRGYFLPSGTENLDDDGGIKLPNLKPSLWRKYGR